MLIMRYRHDSLLRFRKSHRSQRGAYQVHLRDEVCYLQNIGFKKVVWNWLRNMDAMVAVENGSTSS